MSNPTMNTPQDSRAYGDGDKSFQTAGGEAGLKQLADDFYIAMQTLPQAAHILGMHDKDLTTSSDKLYRFLCGWLGGPKLYREKYGSIAIPKAHAHLDIGIEERDAWLACMAEALKDKAYPEDFKAYLMEALMFPADRCRNR